MVAVAYAEAVNYTEELQRTDGNYVGPRPCPRVKYSMMPRITFLRWWGHDREPDGEDDRVS